MGAGGAARASAQTFELSGDGSACPEWWRYDFFSSAGWFPGGFHSAW